MERAKREKYTLEFKQEAVRLVDQTLHKLGAGGAAGKAEGRGEEGGEQREISRLRAELARDGVLRERAEMKKGERLAGQRCTTRR
jgi:hypothetical protein